MKPQTWNQLADAGWVYDNDARCKGCGAQIEWWYNANGNKVPMSIVEKKDGVGFFAKTVEFLRVPHFATCENAAQFRRKKK